MSTLEAFDYRIQESLWRLLEDNPSYRSRLEEIILWEENHPPNDQWDGWRWQDVHTSPAIISRMIASGVVDLRYESQRTSQFRLRSLPDAREALTNADGLPAAEKQQSVEVDKLFSLVVGHEEVKLALRLTLRAERPVHACLYGPPGTAKTLILSDVAGLPAAECYLGSTTTKAGMVGMLLTLQPRYLVIDELDKMDERDTRPLLSLMEGGMVSRVVHGSVERMVLNTRVFAGANDIGKLPRPIFDRFTRLYVPAYTKEQFVQVAATVLVRREGQEPATAALIANAVVEHSTDIRDAVRVARMASGDLKLIPTILSCLFRSRREVPQPSGIVPMRRGR